MNKPVRQPRRALHGVILLDKPLGLSSNDALQKVRRLMRAEKAGHTGTLDPLATGVLPLCFGAATKFSQLQLDAPKTYEAIALLGATTTTGDPDTTGSPGSTTTGSTFGQNTATTTGGGNFYIFKKAPKEQQEAAFKFIQWITQPERAAQWIAEDGR